MNPFRLIKDKINTVDVVDSKVKVLEKRIQYLDSQVVTLEKLTYSIIEEFKKVESRVSELETQAKQKRTYTRKK